MSEPTQGTESYWQKYYNDNKEKKKTLSKTIYYRKNYGIDYETDYGRFRKHKSFYNKLAKGHFDMELIRKIMEHCEAYPTSSEGFGRKSKND